jgi:putative ATP-dependent endonuclease of OLD family
MKIDSVRIKNFRTFSDHLVEFADYICLAGPNGAGKSTVLTALNVFFRNNDDQSTNLITLSEEDFHQKNTSKPIVITVTFKDLSAEAQSDFSNYVRQGKLIISAIATWDAKTKSATVLQFGERLGIKDFAEFFKADGDGAKVEELRKLYGVIRASYKSLPDQSTKPKMTDALHDYENSHSGDCVPLQSADQFYGISKGKNLLQKYVQWIFVPAVKDASAEQLEARNTALAEILQRTVRAKMSFSGPLESLRAGAIEQYNVLLAQYQGTLSILSGSLTSRIQEWAHPDASITLKWFSEAAKAVVLAEPMAQVLIREGTFEGQLGRFGHGLRRSFLLALLEELADAGTSDAPTLILACEEPELYQHPPQIRHLSTILSRLSERGNQVLVCTHSSYFVRGNSFEDIRMVRRDIATGLVSIRQARFADYADLVGKAEGKKPLKESGTALKVAQVLQPIINEMFFTSVLVLMEGPEDIAYLTSYLSLMDLWDEFRRLGCHAIAPYRGKSNLHQPLAIAKLLGIPTFVVFDADADKCDRPDRKLAHERDNKSLLVLCDSPECEALPSDTVWNDSFVMWNKDFGSALSEDIGPKEWESLANRVRNKLGASDTPDLPKNSLFIGALLATAWDEKIEFKSLEKLCKTVIAFASKTSSLKKPATA